jgi:hypothetical protein
LTEIVTPADIVRELARLRAESEKGIAYLAEVETKAVTCELEADRQQAVSFLQAQGTVADREAIAKLESQDARQAAQLAKVEVNRVKLKLKHLSEAMMATQTASRMVDLQWRTAGVGER